MLAPSMTPEWSDGKIEKPRYLGVLLLGPPLVGKTTSAVGTAPGPVYVINSDGRDSLTAVKRRHPNVKFASNNVYTRKDMEGAIVVARDLVKKDEIKTIVWDTLSSFAEGLEYECAKLTENEKGEPDGRRYWPVYTKYLLQTVSRLRKIDAHIIVCSHFIDTSSDQEEGDKKKTGDGIVPLLGRKARLTIGKEFADIIFMDRDLSKNRVFRTGVAGKWGPGGRNTDGDLTMPPDFAEFMKVAGFKASSQKIASPEKVVSKFAPKQKQVTK